MIPFLHPGSPFPPATKALKRPNGLLAAGGDLSLRTLVDAYSHGIFPWYSEGDPILWWSPDPRMVMPSAELHVSRSLRRRLKRRDVRVSFDEAFLEVLTSCAAPRGEEAGTWLLPEMQTAYLSLRNEGLAHSVEVWAGPELIGGLYGVAIGRMFFGESMFSRRTDGSKLALAYLAAQFTTWGLPMIDCQMETEHLQSMGARVIPRRLFLPVVAGLCRETGPATWRFDPDLDPVEVLAHSRYTTEP
jgi:leucyl/phenylalanyl-tRNA---protein transferase